MAVREIRVTLNGIIERITGNGLVTSVNFELDPEVVQSGVDASSLMGIPLEILSGSANNSVLTMISGTSIGFRDIGSLPMSASAIGDIPVGDLSGIQENDVLAYVSGEFSYIDVNNLSLSASAIRDVPVSDLSGISDQDILVYSQVSGSFANVDVNTLPLSASAIRTVPVSSLAGIANGDILSYQSGTGEFSPVNVSTLPLSASAIRNIPVSDLSGISDQDVLIYSQASGSFIAANVNTLPLSASAIRNVPVSNLSGIANQEILAYNQASASFENVDINTLPLSASAIREVPVSDLAGISNQEILIYNQASGSFVSANVNTLPLSASAIRDVPVSSLEGISQNEVLMYDSITNSFMYGPVSGTFTALDNKVRILPANSTSAVAYDTIAEAIAVANSGDVIYLGNGPYAEGNLVLPAGVKLQSIAGTRITGDGVNTTLTVSDNCILDGYLGITAPNVVGKYGIDFSGSNIFGSGGSSLVISGAGSNATGVNVRQFTTLAGSALLAGTMNVGFLVQSGSLFRPVTLAVSSLNANAALVCSGSLRVATLAFRLTSGVSQDGIVLVDGCDLTVFQGSISGFTDAALRITSNDPQITLRNITLTGNTYDVRVDPGLTGVGTKLHLEFCDLNREKWSMPNGWFNNANFHVIANSDENDSKKIERVGRNYTGHTRNWI